MDTADDRKVIGLLFSRLGKQPVTLEAAIQDWLLDLETSNRTAKTLDGYRTNMQRFVWFCQQMDYPETLANLDRSHVQSFLSYVKTNKSRWGRDEKHAPSNKQVTPRTVAVYRTILHSFWNHCVDAGFVQDNIVAKIKPPKAEHRLVVPLKEEDIRALVDACRKTQSVHKQRDTAIVLLLIDTGLRASELCGVQLQDWDAKRLRVYGKGHKERWLPLSAPTARAISLYVTQSRPETYYDELFMGERGTPLQPRGLYQMLKRRAREAGVSHVYVHLMRHSFAFAWCRSGGPLHALQAILGHATPTMSMRYGRMASDDTTQLHHQHSPVERMGLRFKERK